MRNPRWWLLGWACAAALFYAAVIEPRWLQLRRVKIRLRGLPPALEGLRIALLTDLHAGGATSLSLVRRAARLAAAEQPHLIALTGDFAADDSPDFSAVLEALGPIDAPLGVYAVPGNHDYVVGIELWRRQISAHPTIRDLTNRFRIVEHRGARLCIAGVDDYYAGEPRLILPDRAFRDGTILLAHSPNQAERSRRGHDAVDLVVSGHTHAGQIRLPFIGAPLNWSGRDHLYVEGIRRRPWTQVYTSRGIGTVHLPLRFLARPEVALLELTRSRRPPLGPRLPPLAVGASAASP